MRVGDLFFSLIKTTLTSLIIAAVAFGSVGLGWIVVRPHPPTDEKLAIILVQNHIKSGVETAGDLLMRFVGVSQNEHTDEFVQKEIGTLRGDVTVHGWEAKEVAPNTYLVKFTWTTGGKSWQMPYEANTTNRYVRPILPDDALAMKYGLLTKEEYQKLDQASKDAIETKFGSGILAVSYGDHVLKVRAPQDIKFSAEEFARYLYKEARPLMGERKDQYLKVVVAKGPNNATYDGDTP